MAKPNKNKIQIKLNYNQIYYKNMEIKKVKLPEVKLIVEDDKLFSGIVLKRELTLKECRFIMENILGIVLETRDEFDEEEEYNEYNDNLVGDVNSWLVGDCDDYTIMEYAYDCADEPIGIWKAISVLMYLEEKKLL